MSYFVVILSAVKHRKKGAQRVVPPGNTLIFLLAFLHRSFMIIKNEVLLASSFL